MGKQNPFMGNEYQTYQYLHYIHTAAKHCIVSYIPLRILKCEEHTKGEEFILYSVMFIQAR